MFIKLPRCLCTFDFSYYDFYHYADEKFIIFLIKYQYFDAIIRKYLSDLNS